VVKTTLIPRFEWKSTNYES